MKKLIFAAAACGALVFGGAASAATNLVENGSFETGDRSAWDYTGVGADTAVHPATVIGYNNTLPYPGGAFGELIPPDDTNSGSPDPVGQYAAYFVADNSIETLSQTVSLGVGTYSIGFSVYVPRNGFNNSGNATFTGTIAGMTLANFTVDQSAVQDWMHFFGTVDITTAGDYLAAFTYNSGAAPAGDFVIDRVYIVAGDVSGGVPEPGTWALMILGFGGAGAMLRRRKAILA